MYTVLIYGNKQKQHSFKWKDFTTLVYTGLGGFHFTHWLQVQARQRPGSQSSVQISKQWPSQRCGTDTLIIYTLLYLQCFTTQNRVLRNIHQQISLDILVLRAPHKAHCILTHTKASLIDFPMSACLNFSYHFSVNIFNSRFKSPMCL